MVEADAGRFGGRVVEPRVQLAGDGPINHVGGVYPPESAGEMLATVDLVVQLDAPVIIVARLTGTIDVVKKRSTRDVRSRNQRNQTFGYPADSSRINYIVRERIPHKATIAVWPGRCRIEKRKWIVGEIAVPFLHRGKSH